MSVGDIVSPRVRVNENPQTLQSQPPVFGQIAAESAPGSVQVVWDQLNVVTIPVTALGDANLDVLSTPSSSVTTAMLGRMVRRVTGTNTTLDPSGGTSREYDAKVVACYKRAPLEGGADPVDFILAQCEDGTFFEDVASNWVAAEGV